MIHYLSIISYSARTAVHCCHLLLVHKEHGDKFGQMCFMKTAGLQLAMFKLMPAVDGLVTWLDTMKAYKDPVITIVLSAYWMFILFVYSNIELLTIHRCLSYSIFLNEQPLSTGQKKCTFHVYNCISFEKQFTRIRKISSYKIDHLFCIDIFCLSNQTHFYSHLNRHKGWIYTSIRW